MQAFLSNPPNFFVIFFDHLRIILVTSYDATTCRSVLFKVNGGCAISVGPATRLLVQRSFYITLNERRPTTMYGPAPCLWRPGWRHPGQCAFSTGSRVWLPDPESRTDLRRADRTTYCVRGKRKEADIPLRASASFMLIRVTGFALAKRSTYAFLTLSTMALKASGLFMARSASTLRLISTPALWMRPMSLE